MNQKKKIENYQQIAMGNGMGLTLSSMHPMQDIRI